MKQGKTRLLKLGVPTLLACVSVTYLSGCSSLDVAGQESPNEKEKTNQTANAAPSLSDQDFAEMISQAKNPAPEVNFQMESENHQVTATPPPSENLDASDLSESYPPVNPDEAGLLDEPILNSALDQKEPIKGNAPVEVEEIPETEEETIASDPEPVEPKEEEVVVEAPKKEAPEPSVKEPVVTIKPKPEPKPEPSVSEEELAGLKTTIQELHQKLEASQKQLQQQIASHEKELKETLSQNQAKQPDPEKSIQKKETKVIVYQSHPEEDSKEEKEPTIIEEEKILQLAPSVVDLLKNQEIIVRVYQYQADEGHDTELLEQMQPEQAEQLKMLEDGESAFIFYQEKQEDLSQEKEEAVKDSESPVALATEQAVEPEETNESTEAGLILYEDHLLFLEIKEDDIVANPIDRYQEEDELEDMEPVHILSVNVSFTEKEEATETDDE